MTVPSLSQDDKAHLGPLPFQSPFNFPFKAEPSTKVKLQPSGSLSYRCGLCRKYGADINNPVLGGIFFCFDYDNCQAAAFLTGAV